MVNFKMLEYGNQKCVHKVVTVAYIKGSPFSLQA